MTEHYYTENPISSHDVRHISYEILGSTFECDTDAGVFSRDGLDRGTEILLNALPDISGRILDLGCGWGGVGIALGKRYPELNIVMTDINQRAVDLARNNAAQNGVKAQIVQGDGYGAVEGPFDAIITNPPIRAGKALIYEWFDRARDYVAPNGALYVVIRKQQGAPSALKHLRETWNQAEILDRSSGYWVIMAR